MEKINNYNKQKREETKKEIENGQKEYFENNPEEEAKEILGIENTEHPFFVKDGDIVPEAAKLLAIYKAGSKNAWVEEVENSSDIIKHGQVESYSDEFGEYFRIFHKDKGWLNGYSINYSDEENNPEGKTKYHVKLFKEL